MNEINDVSMQTKLSNIDFVAKEVKYHNICRVAYQNKYNQFYDSKKKIQTILISKNPLGK